MQDKIKKILDFIKLDIKFGDLSKKYQLIITVTGLLIIISVAFSLILPRIIKVLLKDEFIAKQNFVVDATANNLSILMSISDDIVCNASDFDDATFHLQNLPHFTHLFVYNADEVKLYKSINSNYDLHIQLFRPRNDIRNYMESAFDLYVVNSDILDSDNTVLGSITCVFSTEELNATTNRAQLIIFLVCLFLLLFGTLLTAFISTLISKPLDSILGTVKIISEGNLSVRAEINTNEEFGQLSRTLNKMIDNLEASYFELSETNKNMELMIGERTQQLRDQIEVRTKAEEKLKATNKMIFSIINTSPLPILTLSNEFKIKTASPAFIKTFKYEEYEVIERVLPFLTLSDVESLMNSLKLLNNPNQIERFVLQGRKKDGTLMDLHITAVSEFDDDNNKFGYILVIDDITDRLLAEKALRESEIKYRSLIEYSIIGIGILKNDKFIFANSALLSIWNCDSLNDFISVPFADMVSSNDKDVILEILNSTSNQIIEKDKVELELMIICFDRTEKYVQMSSSILHLEAETLVQITFVDITARKIAETEMMRLNEELEERVLDRTSKLNKTLVDLRNEMSQRVKVSKELQFKSEVLEYTTSFCVVFNKKGEAIYVSPYSEALLGWKLEELKGKQIFDKIVANVLGKDELINVDAILYWLTNHETLKESYVLKLKTKNDDIIYLRLSNSIGQGNTLIIAGAEITEQVLTQQTLEEMGKQLEKGLESEKELHELKTRFISMVSHEFRTPLTVILNCAGVIEQAIENNRADIGMKYLDRINKSVKTMNDLMEDVLAIGKGETNKVKEVEEINIVEFVTNSLRDIQEAYSFNCRAVLEVRNNCKPFYSDEAALKHIIHNLITNALKYTTNGGDAQIILEREDDNLLFTVADQGIGIPDDDMKRLFSNFFRASNVGKISGTGLGLHIVKQSVDNLLGEISVESVVNQGTTFKVKLPMDIRNKLNEM